MHSQKKTRNNTRREGGGPANFSGDVLGSVPTATHRKLGAEFFASWFSLQWLWMMQRLRYVLVLVQQVGRRIRLWRVRVRQ